MEFYKYLTSHDIGLHFFGYPVWFDALLQTLNQRPTEMYRYFDMERN